MKNKIKDVIIGVLALACLILALELRSTHYELKQVKASNADWWDYADWARAKHIEVTSNLTAKINALEKTNVVLTNR